MQHPKEKKSGSVAQLPKPPFSEARLSKRHVSTLLTMSVRTPNRTAPLKAGLLFFWFVTVLRAIHMGCQETFF
jgi:hypothetical protein